jgi:TupA-like ATPgrasp
MRAPSLSRQWKNRQLDWRRRIAAHFIDDRRYLSQLYRDRFGTPPDLEHPRGFNEKILLKILADRREFLTLFADKLRARDFVRSKTPNLALPQLYWWSGSAESLPLDALPRAFVLKANHGSGWVEVVADKRLYDHAVLVKLAKRWLASDFTIVGREWAYRNVQRAAYAEELLGDPAAGPPPDYKLFVFDGVVRMIQVDRDRHARHTQVLYDAGWNLIEGTVAARQGSPQPRPAALAEMIDAARRLAAGIDFVRVDLYEIAGRVYFGELTNYPNKGLSPFRPASLDRLLGSWLTLDSSRPIPIAYQPEIYAEMPNLPHAAG